MNRAINSEISIRYSKNAKKGLNISVSNLSNFGVEPIKNALGNQKVTGPWREISIQLKDGKTIFIVMIVSASFKSWYGKSGGLY